MFSFVRLSRVEEESERVAMVYTPVVIGRSMNILVTHADGSLKQVITSPVERVFVDESGATWVQTANNVYRFRDQ
jgi:hypothetical protein